MTSPSLSEGIIGDYTTTNLPTTVTNLISDPLVSLDAKGVPQPELAQSWTVNQDATIYTFTLKNVYWSDGSKLKSSDLQFNIPNADVSYPDDKTIVFTLKESFSPLLGLLTTPVLKGDSLVGTGKYKVTNVWFDRDGLTITKMQLAPRVNDIPDMTLHFYQDEQTAKTGFFLGEAQVLLGVTDYNDVTTSSQVKVQQIPNFNKIAAIFYNTKDPILSDKNFRKALAYGVPPVEGEEYAKTSVPSSSWAYNDQVRDFIGHLDQAAGYLDKVKVGKDQAITLTVTPQLEPLAQKIVQGWKQIGINTVTRVESGVPQNFQALLITQPMPSDPDQYFLWHSLEVKTNLSQYKSERVDKDLEDARKTPDAQKRKDLYLDMQKVLADDQPATFIYFPKFNVVYLKKAEDSLNKVLSLQMRQS